MVDHWAWSMSHLCVTSPILPMRAKFGATCPVSVIFFVHRSLGSFAVTGLEKRLHKQYYAINSQLGVFVERQNVACLVLTIEVVCYNKKMTQ